MKEIRFKSLIAIRKAIGFLRGEGDRRNQRKFGKNSIEIHVFSHHLGVIDSTGNNFEMLFVRVSHSMKNDNYFF